MAATARRGAIRVGVGGWTYEPWRDNFFPAGLAQSQELAYASRQLTAIEINGTYYGSQKPATFAKWRDETPEDFIFSMKASRFSTNRKVLADGKESVSRFVDSGISELGAKLGPIVWQFATTKRFEPDDFEAFVDLLPKKIDSLPLRHVLDVRHDSFKVPEFLALARRHGAATVYTDSSEYPSIADVTGDFVYARLMCAEADIATGYPADALDAWAKRAKSWATGKAPADLPLVDAKAPASKAASRDVFVYFINGAKERAPAAAKALIERL